MLYRERLYWNVASDRMSMLGDDSAKTLPPHADAQAHNQHNDVDY
jgi:hypothetical protein